MESDRTGRVIAAFDVTTAPELQVDTASDAVDAVRQLGEWAEARRPHVAAELGQPVPPFSLQERGVLTQGHVTGDGTTLHQDPYYVIRWSGEELRAVACQDTFRMTTTVGASFSFSPSGDAQPLVTAFMEFLGAALTR